MGRRQGRGAAPRGRQRLRRRPRARRRGGAGRRRAERVGADRRQHPRGAARRPGRTSCSTRSPSSRRGSTSTCSTTRLAALEADLRARGSVLVAYSGGADSAFLLAAAVRAVGADRVVAATGYSHSLPAGRARPGARVRRVARRRGAHPGDARDGARGLPRQRRGPLLLLQGRAGRGARRDRRPARARGGRDRYQRRRRGRRLPARHPRRRRARCRRPAARRRADQGAGARGVAPVGPADVGQAGGRLPVVAGRVRRRGHAARPRPRGAGRGRRTPRAARVRNLRVRDLGGDRASVEVDADLLPLDDDVAERVAGRRPRGRVRARPRSTRAASGPGR